MNKLLTALASFHGIFADKDFIWWPFSFLRPEKNQIITLKNTITMTLCFGGASSLMLAVVALMNNAFELKSQIQTYFIINIVFFGWFNLVTAPLWNYRAKNLQK